MPKSARMEFHDLASVEARTGMTSHGQAQLAIGRQLAEIFSDPTLQPGDTAFHDRDGRFLTPAFIADEKRQADLLHAGVTLAGEALTTR